MNEVWKDIDDFYQISNLGNVKSRRRGKWRTLKTPDNSSGYPSVNLCSNGQQKKVTVHRLVANAFIPRVQGKEHINHKDGDKHNNRVDNLEWCTPSENTKHAFDTGLKELTRKKAKITCTKIQPAGIIAHIQKSSQIIEVANIKTGEKMIFHSINEAARTLGCYQGNLSAVINGRIKQTAGFTARKIDNEHKEEHDE